MIACVATNADVKTLQQASPNCEIHHEPLPQVAARCLTHTLRGLRPQLNREQATGVVE